MIVLVFCCCKTAHCARGSLGRSRDGGGEVDAKKFRSFRNVANSKFLGTTIIYDVKVKGRINCDNVYSFISEYCIISSSISEHLVIMQPSLYAQ